MKKHLGIYSSETWDSAMTAEVFINFIFNHIHIGFCLEVSYC